MKMLYNLNFKSFFVMISKMLVIRNPKAVTNQGWTQEEGGDV